MGVMAERFGQLLGPQRWTNYLIVGGRLVGIHVENADETTLTRYFHTDHLGSIAVITDEVGVVTQRLSYDAWGLRRHPDGTPDPAGAIQAESTRGFTGHEHLAEVGLIHMNGRVYDPLLARFGTPDPMTEDPYSTQGWNRYSYVGNSPVNFTDPSGYCFMGCFWKPLFKAIGNFFRQSWGTIVQIAATAICTPVGLGPVCGAVAAAVVTGITSGDLGLAIRAGITAYITAEAFNFVGNITGHRPSFGTADHIANIAGHALVGCGSSVARGGRCGPGALSGAVGSFASPLLGRMDFTSGLVAHAVVGGLASVAAGGNFANGAVTASFGYLFNQWAARRHRNERDAARDALSTADRWARAQNSPNEWAGLIYMTEDGEYSFTRPLEGGLDWSRPMDGLRYLPDDAIIVGTYHTHGRDTFDGGGEYYSSGDVELYQQLKANKEGIPNLAPSLNHYLLTPEGVRREFNLDNPAHLKDLKLGVPF